MHIVERTCTLENDLSGQGKQEKSKSLGKYRDMTAYVLLGNPGSGKTTAFHQETREQQDSVFVTARDIVTFDANDHPEWQDKTLFIDGLDEIRAGSPDFRTPFDRIRSALDKLNRPCFRISCREADWLGAFDQEHLQTVSPDNEVLVLHLDPLTETDIKHILSSRFNDMDVVSFIEEAKNHGLGQLLFNPLTLDLLANAVGGGTWPTTRKEVLERACQILCQEHNREHGTRAGSQVANPNQLLDMAGYLSAIQLISGNAGYGLSIAAQANDFPFIGEIGDNDVVLLKRTLQTRLFKGCSEEQVEPVHRHVGEYLAARHLARRLNREGLALGRILALMTGEDGIVISGLRGLSAWLAVFCIDHRRAIIDRDSLGVVLYGDVRQFSQDDKRYLLDALYEEAKRYSWFRISHWQSSSFGGIATPDMENEFRRILTSSDRDPAYQELALCVLDAMLHGERISELNDVLIGVVRNTDWGPSVRYAALEVICRFGKSSYENMLRMKRLLDEINHGIIKDSNERLKGFLLCQLYPRIVTSETVFDYLHAPDDPNFIGGYAFFWSQILHEQSSDDDIKILLDQIASRHDKPNKIPGNLPWLKVSISRLIHKGLEVHGTSIEPDRLYEWLGIGLDNYGSDHGPGTIPTWLENHPDIQKVLMIVGQRNCLENQNFISCMYKIKERLREARPPNDYGLWCLERLAAVPNTDTVRFWLQEAVSAIIRNEGNTGLSLDAIKRAVEDNQVHRDLLEEMLPSLGEVEEQISPQSRDRQEQQEREQRQMWLEHVKSQKHSLQEGNVHPRLLHDLASAYFGFCLEVGEESSKQLLNLLGGDENLKECALEGLRRSIDRDDVPDVEEIFILSTKNEEHLLGRAWLAGMIENSRLSPDFALGLSDGQLRKALAFYVTGNTGDEATWFNQLLEHRPEAIAETLIHYVSMALNRKSQNITVVRHLLYKLVFESKYSSVAKQAVPTLLKSFPIRCNAKQLELLHAMLVSTVNYLDRGALRAQIEGKLCLSSMNVPQRICWLAVGLVAAPDIFERRFAEFMEGNESRARHLARFLSFARRDRLPINNLPMSGVGLLVEILGRYFSPYSMKGCVQKTSAMFTAGLIGKMISLLASNASQDAAEILVSLSENEHLEKWRSHILDAQFKQRTVRREACFRHPDIDQVVATLKNSHPANAGDLAALIFDILLDMAQYIRNGNTDDYNQFWNEPKGNLPATPKHEDLCRDALLSDLQQRLAAYQIDAQPEARYAEDKRADIRISFGGLDGPAIPIEIKKNSHSDLWKAIQNQLIAQYVRDSRAGGYGIYLVLWFGPNNMTTLSPQGRRPVTPAELADGLRKDLTDEEKRKISVCVMDVTSPRI